MLTISTKRFRKDVMVFTLMCFAAVVIMQPHQEKLDQAISLLDQLDSTFISIDYHDETLRRVVEDLNTRLPMRLQADWNALERLGVRQDDRVSLRMNEVSAATVLAGVAFAVGDELERPLCEAHAGQIIFTALDATSVMRLTEAYDVRDLLANPFLLQRLHDESPLMNEHDNQHAPEDLEHRNSQAAPTAAPDENAQPAFVPPLHPAPNLSLPNLNQLPSVDEWPPMTPGEKLLMLITDHIDPEAWRNFGGDRGMMSDLNGVLLVSATPSTHRRLRHALRSLRAANPTSIMVDAYLIDLPRSMFNSISRQHASPSTAYAHQLRNNEKAATLWQTSDSIALNAPLEVESIANDTHVRLALQPAMNTQTGVLEIAVEASSNHAADQRRVKTSVSLTSDQPVAIVELPAATASDTMRLLVLAAQRK